ncbi:bestrophin-like domain [Kitasatospora sp. NPDC001664]|uniref:bestrophin-like domain n=1 Tax=Kitasatospora albolonga TaxID=68173 RepID=UPI0035E843F7
MWTVALVSVAGAALALLLGLLLGRTQRSKAGETSPQALAFSGAAVLGFFALFTGFSIAGAWQQLNVAREQTFAESRALTETYWTAKGLAAPDRVLVRTQLRTYTGLVKGEEWREMQHGHGSAQAWRAIDDVRTTAEHARAESPDEVAARADVVRNLTDVYAKRTTRVADTKAAVPEVVLGGLFVGAFFVLATPPVIGLTSNARNLVLMCFVGASVAFGVSLVVELSGPYTGVVRVQPTAFELAEFRFGQIDTGTVPG